MAGGLHLHAPGKALAAREHDAADGGAVHMLGHLHDPAAAVGLHRQRLPDAGELPGGERHVHHRS